MIVEYRRTRCLRYTLHKQLREGPRPRLLWWQWRKDTLIWLPTTYKVCQTPCTCMKWIWYEYAGVGRSQSYPTACPQWEPHSESYDWPTPFWSDGIVWCCGIMTASHGSRLLNTFYRYEVDLVWVWSGWEVLIISYSMSPVKTPLKILRLAHPLWSDGIVWCCGIMTASHGSRLLNTFYRYNAEVHPVWSGSLALT
jgi:hypothetical protein